LALTPLPHSPVGDRRGGTDSRSAATLLKNFRGLESLKVWELGKTKFFAGGEE
jgi:hypothetical protein